MVGNVSASAHVSASAFYVAGGDLSTTVGSTMNLTSNSGLGINVTSTSNTLMLQGTPAEGGMPAIRLKAGEHEFVHVSGSLSVGADASGDPSTLLHVSSSGDEGLFQVDGLTAGTVLFATGSGRVGIGTTDPGCQLDIRMEPTNNGDQLRLGNASNYYKMGRGADGFLHFQGTQGGFTGYTFKNDDGSVDLSILDSGHVGIGCAVPSAQLAVSGAIAAGGNILPGADNTHDLGSAAKRWANVYTGDLHLANERGDWTVVEEEDYLTIRNNKTGKRFKLLMEEIE